MLLSLDFLKNVMESKSVGEVNSKNKVETISGSHKSPSLSRLPLDVGFGLLLAFTDDGITGFIIPSLQTPVGNRRFTVYTIQAETLHQHSYSYFVYYSILISTSQINVVTNSSVKSLASFDYVFYDEILLRIILRGKK